MAKAFIPNPNNLAQINHKDEDKTNNRVENLEWCDQSYNMNYGTRTQRANQSNFIPIVGKILGDSLDTVMSCSNILKNAVGIVGVVVIISICISPIIKLATLMGAYYLGSAICQPIADEKIVKLFRTNWRNI